MRKIQSVLCAVALAIALSPTALAGNIHGVSAYGNIHGVKSTLLTDIIVAILGNIHG